ncbi:hypothetical protein [Chitinophaga flava]|uniref:DUF1579 domain-containing protein n=1 Tax=Chitinophaga flava TaxID=2259036 RepID=A0A365Y3H5_9BACT|nr:hypothetical protein [Chitinophaga flava]RBL92868.1 hypothetical protein DF182_09890 [Chitinophaga flava]
MKYLVATAMLCLGLSSYLQAQTNTNKLPEDLMHFFTGNWSGEGEFSNGRKIAADLSFQLSLDSSWIMYEHTDKAPNHYKAHSMWGIDAQTGQFAAYAFDNFQGHRKFDSNGWKNGKLILTCNTFYPKTGVQYQHFIYEKLSDQSFKMTYETSNDGITWRMIDYLTFTRK